MMLTDAEFAAKMSIPDVTDKVDTNLLYEYGADQFLYELSGSATWKRALEHADYLNELSGSATWKRVLEHADYLNEKHYEDHLSFRVVKHCQDYYVLNKVIAKEKLGIDF